MQPAIQVQGADELAKVFRALGRSKDLTRAYREISKVWLPTARAGASGGTAQQSVMDKALKASATQKSARLLISGSASYPGAKFPGGAVGAFYGSIKYRQFQRWIGNSWQLPETGPYNLTGSYRVAEPAMINALEDGVLRLAEERGLAVSKSL